MSDQLSDVVNVAVDLGQKIAQPVTSEPLHFAVVPEGCELQSLEVFQFAEHPIRKRSLVTLYDVGSFVDYYNLFDDEHSRIFANPDKRSFMAVLDYHHAGGRR